jgi:hypothetical protein
MRAIDELANRLRPQRFALLLSMLALLYGFGMGIAFGGFEDNVRGRLERDGRAVLAERYGGDEAKLKSSLDKAWSYQKRAHMHAGGLGSASLVLIVLLALASRPSLVTRGTGALLGIGALGYPLYWMVAGLAAPRMGGTGAAKEAFAWLAMPTAGALVVGTMGTMVVVTLSLQRSRAT